MGIVFFVHYSYFTVKVEVDNYKEYLH